MRLRMAVLVGTLIWPISAWSEDYPQRFQEGDIVVMKLDGRKGTVVHAFCLSAGSWDVHHACRYDVRFVSDAIYTDTHLLDPDGPLKTRPYAIEEVYDYELQ